MDPFDALSLCAEIAIAITGFSGVVLVFGERGTAAWSAVDRTRFRMLFTASLTPLGLVALAFVLGAALGRGAEVWRICSVVYVVSASTTAFFNTRDAARAASDNDDLQIPRFASTWKGGAIALSVAIAVIVLQAANAALLHSFWPVLLAAWWGIALSLFSFVGLLLPGRSV